MALSGGGQADQQGALTAIAGEPFGLVVIAVIVLGLLAFGVWQGLAAATGYRWASGWDRAQKRIGSGARALAVLGVALIGARLLFTGSSGSSTGGSQEATAGVLALPGGRLLVGVAALVVLIAAGATAWTGSGGTSSPSSTSAGSRRAPDARWCGSASRATCSARSPSR